MEDDRRQDGDEDGVSREDDGHHVGLAQSHGQLEEDHTQADVEKAGHGEVAQVGPGQGDALLFQGVGGHGDQAQTAHQETLHGDLEGVEGPGHGGEF